MYKLCIGSVCAALWVALILLEDAPTRSWDRARCLLVSELMINFALHRREAEADTCARRSLGQDEHSEARYLIISAIALNTYKLVADRRNHSHTTTDYNHHANQSNRTKQAMM
jgi:hypothetical protein